MNKPKVLWLIVARSGSKSIPNKNIKLLNGIPLLAYRIKSAIESNYSKYIWISTDSEEYAKIAELHGASVPFIRPKQLAEDKTSTTEVVLHAMNHAKQQSFKFDYIAVLEPTSPFISEIDLNKAISKLNETIGAKSIVSVKESRPNKIFIQDEAPYLDLISEQIRFFEKLGRQEFKMQITPSGGFYIAKWESFLLDKTFYTSKTLAYLVNEIAGLEIDEPIDFEFAEFLVNRV